MTRIYILPRMGCLGWLIFGWFILIAYAFVWGSVITFALVLYAVAGIAAGVDWTMSKAIGSYGTKRRAAPLRWPRRLAGTGTAAVASLGGYRGR